MIDNVFCDNNKCEYHNYGCCEQKRSLVMDENGICKRFIMKDKMGNKDLIISEICDTIAFLEEMKIKVKEGSSDYFTLNIAINLLQDYKTDLSNESKDIIYQSKKQTIDKNKYLNLHDLTKTITIDKVIMHNLNDEDKLVVRKLLKQTVSYNFILYKLVCLFTNITSDLNITSNDDVDMETVKQILDNPNEIFQIVKERLNIIIYEVNNDESFKKDNNIITGKDAEIIYEESKIPQSEKSKKNGKKFMNYFNKFTDK